MAKPTKKSDEPAKIRISATDTKSAKKKATASKSDKKTAVATVAATEGTTERRNPFVVIKDYFVGAWHELKQVRWPNRKATWGLTLAVIIYTVFFAVLIVLLDSGFQLIFERILS